MIKKSISYRVFTVFNYIILTLIALMCLYPFYYVILASISDPAELVF